MLRFLVVSLACFIANSESESDSKPKLYCCTEWFCKRECIQYKEREIRGECWKDSNNALKCYDYRLIKPTQILCPENLPSSGDGRWKQFDQCMECADATGACVPTKEDL